MWNLQISKLENGVCHKEGGEEFSERVHRRQIILLVIRTRGGFKELVTMFRVEK